MFQNYEKYLHIPQQKYLDLKLRCLAATKTPLMDVLSDMTIHYNFLVSNKRKERMFIQNTSYVVGWLCVWPLAKLNNRRSREKTPTFYNTRVIVT